MKKNELIQEKKFEIKYIQKYRHATEDIVQKQRLKEKNERKIFFHKKWSSQ